MGKQKKHELNLNPPKIEMRKDLYKGLSPIKIFRVGNIENPFWNLQTKVSTDQFETNWRL